MPLKKGSSKKTISANIRELMHGPQHARTMRKHGAKTAHRQAIAAAMAQARKPRRKKVARKSR